MKGLKRFKSVFYRDKRLSFYIEPALVKELGWNPGDNMQMKQGENGESYLYKSKGVRVTLGTNIDTGQFFITFKDKPIYHGRKMKVRVTKHGDKLVFNWF